MSTRSQIRFVQERTYDGETHTQTAQVYRHSDGYPSGVLPALAQLKALQDATGTERGPSYTAANFIFLNKFQGMGFYADELGDSGVMAAIEERDLSAFEELNQPHFLLGYGVEDTGGIHGDEEYLYVVNIGTLERGGAMIGDGDHTEPTWSVKIAGRGDFPRFGENDDTDDAFEEANWMFDGTLREALDEYAE